MKKLYGLEVRGENHTWDFHVIIDPKYLEEWRADGLKIDEICNIIPEWVASLGLVRPWCFLQDIFHFKNPLAK